MDFERYVRHKRVDIAILFKNKPKIIIEIKKLGEKLDRHVNQALEYAYSMQVKRWIKSIFLAYFKVVVRVPSYEVLPYKIKM